MFSLLAILVYCVATAIPLYLLYRFHHRAWYWHVLAVAAALAVGLMPGNRVLDSAFGSLLYGFVFIVLIVWGAGGLIPFRSHGMHREKHA